MTSRAYSDLRVLSPSGGLVLEALSPDNGNELTRNGASLPGRGFGAMQRNFRYQLRETCSGNVLWERWQEGREPSPVRAHVSDDGYSVVRAHLLAWASEELLFIDATGVPRLVVVVTFPEGAEPMPGLEETEVESPERREHARRFTWADENVQASTGGPHWTGGSAAVFFEAPGAHFSLRTWWGRRIVVDPEAMDVVPDAAHVGDLVVEPPAWASRRRAEALFRYAPG